MKKTLFLIIICFSTYMQAQFDVGNVRDAWKRTAYEKWDDFNPWFYFTFIDGSYDNKDRRTMYSRMGAMTLWSVYADEYKMHLNSVDSVLNAETYKALDKTLNKNWLVLQRPRANVLYDSIEARIGRGIEDGLPIEMSDFVQNRYFDLVTDIQFLQDAYAPDAEKLPLLEQKIKELEDLNILTQYMGVLGYLINQDYGEEFTIDNQEVIDRHRTIIENLIIE